MYSITTTKTTTMYSITTIKTTTMYSITTMYLTVTKTKIKMTTLPRWKAVVCGCVEVWVNWWMVQRVMEFLTSPKTSQP